MGIFGDYAIKNKGLGMFSAGGIAVYLAVCKRLAVLAALNVGGNC
jgi:hypothetical protein